MYALISARSIDLKLFLLTILYLKELENTRNKLSDAEKLILSQDKLVKDLEDKIQENSFSHQRSTSLQSATDSESSIDTSAISEQKTKQISDSLLEEDVAKLSHECKSLQKLVQDLEETNANLRVSSRLN